ncbi:MAG: hypothetical protein K0R90_1141, partial [Oscillospiraceae bacterium]|nr:hypothetical protein [Oscillospiraceae bacterium]
KGNHENLEMSACSFEDFCKQRKEYIEKLDFAIVHGDLMSKYVYQESLYTGAKIINLKSRTLQGYMVCYKINNKLVVKETSLSKTLLLTLFTKMAQEFDINTLEVYGPEKEWSESSVKYGMCKRFFEIEHSEDLRNWPYMNLMLD